MSTFASTLSDSAIMFRRQLLHLRRYPSLTFLLIALPVIFLLMFVYVFGATLGAGLAAGGDRSDYVNYLVPGILLLSLTGSAQGTALSVAMDMTEGIVDRFRSMAISRSAMLTGHVLGSLAQTLIALVVVLATALAVGFRPNATPLEWLAALGVLAAGAFALIWFSVALGIFSDSIETAGNLPNVLLLLPFFGTGFVPTDGMPAALRWFADHQPFTPITETVRGLLLGSEIGGSGVWALGWCTAISLLSYVWARRLYDRKTTS